MAFLNIVAALARAITPKPRQIFTIPTLYSVFLVSMLAAKLVHLYNHLTSLPPLLTLLYMPTFLALDFITAILYFVLLHVRRCGHVSTFVLGAVKGLLCLVELETASSEISFYLETGGEMKWAAAMNFAQDPAGLKVLLSGAMQALLVATILVVVARAFSQPLYNAMNNLTCTIWRLFTNRQLMLSGSQEIEVEELSLETNTSSRLLQSEDNGMDRSPSRESERCEDAPFLATAPQRQRIMSWWTRTLILTPMVTTVILQTVRPTTFPYAHMSGTLPFTLREIWSPSGQAMCQAGFRGDNIFPFPSLVSSSFWEPANGTYPGWMPSTNASLPGQKTSPHSNLPSWLPKQPLDFPGFERWYNSKDDFRPHKPPHPHPGHGEPPRHSSLHRPPPPPPEFRLHGNVRYDPLKDPIRISNFDENILKPITEVLATNSVKIRHIVVISLESTRKDVFPFKKDSHLYDIIMRTHTQNDTAAAANAQLAKISANTELITGEDSGFSEVAKQSRSAESKSWRNLSKVKGGINVIGALTPSTTSLKSFLGSTCGVQSLPVDFTVEVHGYMYQPCIPSILKLFNKNKTSRLDDRSDTKDSSASEEDIRSMPWRSIHAQSTTDQYDFQDELEERMGFSEVIARSTLMDPESKHFPPKTSEANYFGFKEQEIKPYLKDAFLLAKKKNERLFLTHFTSTTHHPWEIPESSGEDIEYMSRNRWGKESALNRYLNTVKYADGWLGEIMDLLEEVGAAEETLVVMVGDHGMTFQEESSAHSTFENGHISNLRVPLTFHHPNLPRLQLNINATSLSIIPTVLDLLSATSSLNPSDTNIANNLMNQYEGQSLIRPFQATKNGRQQWNFGVLNAGGALLSVSSAAVPHRLVLPVCKAGTFRFTSNLIDPNELHPIEEYSIMALARRVEKDKRFGTEAADWVIEAEKVGKWWVKEQRRKWGYLGAALQSDMNAAELQGVGATRKKHWWET